MEPPHASPTVETPGTAAAVRLPARADPGGPQVARSGGLEVRVLHTLEELQALVPAWARLAEDFGSGLPFVLPEWTLAWWPHLSRHVLSVDDRPLTFAVERAGSLVAVAPMMVSHRPRLGPARVRCLQPIGTDPNVTELRRMLCRPEDEAAATEAVLGAAGRHGGWDWVFWSGVECDATWQQLVARPGARPGPEVPYFWLPLAPTWDEFRAGLSRNIKESLRKCVNAPKRDGVELTFEAEGDPAKLPALVETFFALHASRASLADTVVHGDFFSYDPSRNFLRELCSRLAPSGRVRVFSLRHGERIVAARVGFLLGRTVYLYYSGFDPEYGKYSVMTRCVADALRWAVENGFSGVHLSTGRDISKTRWSPEQKTQRAVTLVGSSLRARAAYAAFRLAIRR